MKQIFFIVTALLAGFVGGILGTRVIPPREQPPPGQGVRARRFEVVNEAGQAISYWGVDKGQNAVLAFGSGRALPGHPLGLEDPHNQRAAIGVIDDSPFLKLRGVDGQTRVRLLLSLFGKPVLLMEDESGPRVLLGLEQSDTPGAGDNDWSLAFYPERARIGMYTEKDRGQTYVRGSFSVHRDKVKYPYEHPK
jgi:hypothetical protein